LTINYLWAGLVLRKKLIILATLGIVASYFLIAIYLNLQPQRNDVSISLIDPDVRSTSLTIAVIGDVHLSEGVGPLNKFRALLLDVKAADPDLIVFVGDYTANPSGIDNMPIHRVNIINTLKLVNPIPRAVVLGNYESWSDADEWLDEFARIGVDVMENETRILRTAKGPICIRGFGDNYTGRNRRTDYPEECDGLPRLSITHDPSGAFYSSVKGLVIAGHTHCGQVSFPIIGPLWVPSDAPSSAHCGLYKDSERTVFVTSGVGTSILPLRYGAQSQWDLIELVIIKTE
jgi:predicted MPP superfamily phosphohydrolase